MLLLKQKDWKSASISKTASYRLKQLVQQQEASRNGKNEIDRGCLGTVSQHNRKTKGFIEPTLGIEEDTTACEVDTQ